MDILQALYGLDSEHWYLQLYAVYYSCKYLFPSTYAILRGQSGLHTQVLTWNVWVINIFWTCAKNNIPQGQSKHKKNRYCLLEALISFLICINCCAFVNRYARDRCISAQKEGQWKTYAWWHLPMPVSCSCASGISACHCWNCQSFD